MPAQHIALPSGRWVVDLSRTTVSFTARGAFGASVTGTVPVLAGWVGSGRDGLDVAAHLDLSAIDTGNPRRDRDLRKPRLLDLDSHPVMRFAGRAADAAGRAVEGVLEVRGRAVPIRVEVELPDPAGLATDLAVDVLARTALDRRDLGISVPGFMIGRRIEVTVSTTLVPDQVPAPG